MSNSHGGPGRGQGRKRTDVRNLTATPPEVIFSEPAIGHADVSLTWCAQCGAAWWEAHTATYTTATEQAELDANGYYFHELAEVERPAQREHHYPHCPLRKP